ncbi:hypothetical protein QDA02_gp61 [Microbacterium phage Margaery]|uniref:Uncharacterized protein n=1 Tax=Microbacterium phage Margaery TaxID=2591217 RepID=A0A514DHN3_9CAUD|nr:hypothetical protein QDA02_gp61 [Microbacterium phage Margaery]QDH93104.1 hypothetical protein PBI_MARGAERY_47 [Microbacterium phage Margaery]
MEQRERLAQALWDATRAQEPDDFMPTVMTDMGSCLHVADALIDKGVFMPPEDAERTEGRAIEVTPESEPMPYGGDVMYRDGRAWSNIAGAERDVTDTINEWAARQPGVIVVTYEWPEKRPICPECRDGKHGNCTGEALHEPTDVIVECGCSHGE